MKSHAGLAQGSNMDHNAWKKNIDAVFSLRHSRKYNQAIKKLTALLDLMDKNERNQVEPWHYSETIGLLGLCYEDAGNLEKSAECYVKRAELNKGHALSHGQAAANSLAVASLHYFRLKQTSKAVKLAKEALQLFGLYIDPSPMMEKVSAALRTYYEKKALAKKKPSR